MHYYTTEEAASVLVLAVSTGGGDLPAGVAGFCRAGDDSQGKIHLKE